MSKKKVIIIGAGIAGLSAGCYLQMNGYDTEIYELHNIPGGLCTAWKRQDYTFDGCIHWLCGSSPRDELYTIWEELGAIQGKTFVYQDIFVRTQLETGDSFSMYSDVEKLEAEMLRFAPEDEKLIKAFTQAIRICSKGKLPVLKAPELYTPIDGLKLFLTEANLLRIVYKWGKVSLGDFQRSFKNPLFKSNFAKLAGLYEEMPVFALIYFMALFSQKAAGYPIGGSLGFINSIEKRYNQLGGNISYASKVKEILVKDGKAVGVKLSDNKEFLADLVISAADGYSTIYSLLQGKYVDSTIEGYYKDFKVFPAICQVSLGVNKEITNLPEALTLSFPLQQAISVDPKHAVKALDLKVYNFDPTLAPPGKTVLATFFEADFDYWYNLRTKDHARYKEEKDQLAAAVVAAIDSYLGDIKSKVEVVDIATPATYYRYTSNWQGSFEGFIPTVDNMAKRLKQTLPGLDNFYMIGQWVQPGGGLPTGGMHGRHLAQVICKKDKKVFRTNK